MFGLCVESVHNAALFYPSVIVHIVITAGLAQVVLHKCFFLVILAKSSHCRITLFSCSTNMTCTTFVQRTCIRDRFVLIGGANRAGSSDGKGHT